MHQAKEVPMKRDLNVDAFYGALESKKSELGVSWRGLSSADLASRPRPPSSRSSPRPSSMDTVTASAVTGWSAQAWADGWMTSTSHLGLEEIPGVNVWATKPAGMAGCACSSPSN